MALSTYMNAPDAAAEHGPSPDRYTSHCPRWLGLRWTDTGAAGPAAGAGLIRQGAGAVGSSWAGGGSTYRGTVGRWTGTGDGSRRVELGRPMRLSSRPANGPASMPDPVAVAGRAGAGWTGRTDSDAGRCGGGVIRTGAGRAVGVIRTGAGRALRRGGAGGGSATVRAVTGTHTDAPHCGQ